MNTLKRVVCLLLLCVSAICLCVGCGEKPEEPSGKEDFTGIVFANQTLDYDGQEHTIVATGIPEGATVEYTNAGPFVNAGQYSITVSVSMEGYNTYTKTAKLTINKLNFTGISLTGVTVDYDGNAYRATASGIPSFATANYTNAGPFTDAGDHVTTLKVTAPNYNDFTTSATVKINKIDFVGVEFKDQTFEYDNTPHSIGISGTLPSTAEVTYTSNVQGVTNTATQAGTYIITATITDKNHNTLVLDATLTITASSEERLIKYVSNGTLYYQNALDNNYLYLYDLGANATTRISSDNVVDFVDYNGNGVTYVSSTILISAIKTVTYTTALETETLLTKAGIKYVQRSGNVVYYSINKLTNDASGIYKTDFSGSEPVTTCLSVGKASYLQLSGNTLYFADGANGNKLSKINVTTQNQARTLVVDEKIKNLLLDNGVLYYTVNNLLGDYIESYNISSQTRRKLTIDAGESLTIVGNKLYYVNVDKFTTSAIGSGIYSVNKAPTSNNNNVGIKVIEGGAMGVCSLETDGTNLYYYDVDGYKLMQYNISTGIAKNLLQGFVKPEEPTPISTGSKLQTYNGNIYYLDIWDGKTLHCYNPKTKDDYALTTGKVVDFNIIGDTLYVNMVSFLVNNEVYSTNLKTGSELTKISNYSAYEFVSDGTYVYYIEENAVGAKTAIHKCAIDGTNDEIIYDKGVTNLKLIGNKLYFIEDNNIYAFNLSTETVTMIKTDGDKIHTTMFDTDGTYLYYRDMYGLLKANKRLSRCKLDGSEKVILVEDIDPVNIVYQDNKVYYYSDTTSTAKNGLFVVSANVSVTTAGTAILPESTGLYAKDFVVIGGKVYFVDYKSQLKGDAHLFVIEIGDDEATLIK